MTPELDLPHPIERKDKSQGSTWNKEPGWLITDIRHLVHVTSTGIDDVDSTITFISTASSLQDNHFLLAEQENRQRKAKMSSSTNIEL